MARPDFDLLDLPADPFCTGESVTIFFDTEFTDLTVNSELLSLGLVADDSDAELYVEISDANRADASDFVRAIVLPLFGQFNPAVLTRGDAAKRIEVWLDGLRKGERDRQVIMVSDSPRDWQHLSELLGHVPGQAPWTQALNVIGRTVQMISSPSQIACINEKIDAYHRQRGLQHHALVDARALKTAYRESTFNRFRRQAKETNMAIESLVALGLATAFLVGLAWYANSHRADERRPDIDRELD